VQTRDLNVAATRIDPVVCENGRSLGHEDPVRTGLDCSPGASWNVDLVCVVFKPIGPLDGDGGYVIDLLCEGFNGDALAENLIRLLCPVLVWSSRRLCR
jgi:hypothetical protein